MNSTLPLRLSVASAVFNNKDDFAEFNFLVYVVAKEVQIWKI